MSAKGICIEKDQQISDDGDKDQKVVINSLDYDSLAKIIMLLPIPERIDMEKVCTKWLEACQLAWYDIKKYKCESSIGRCYDNRLLTQSYLEKILSRCGNYLKELSLSKAITSSIIPFIGDHCKNLTSLECKFNVNSLNYYADDFVQAFTQLNKLKCIRIITFNDDRYGETFDPIGIINNLPEEINQIHLISEPPVRTNKIVYINFEKFKNLQELTLQVCYFLDSISLQEIAEKTTLIHLSIRLYDIPEGFFLFDKLVNLEYINLTLVSYLGFKCALQDERNTKVLNTIFCTCKNLKYLKMPTALYNIAEIPREKWINLQNLEYLDIYCYIMPDSANTIVKYCKNLKHLKIYNYSNYPMNDTALKKLTELENLECLILDVLKLHKKSIIAISKNCKKLKRLEIPRCRIVLSINDNLFDYLSVLDDLSKLQCLERLNLCFVDYLKDSTITAIANNCKNLKCLEIQGSTSLTETALVALSNLENLQKLDVSYLDIITDSFLIKLKGLKELYCDKCTNLTDAGMIQFIKNNPDLELLSVYCINNITFDMIIAADQATENRTNGIMLRINLYNPLMKETSKPIIKSQWLVVK